MHLSAPDDDALVYRQETFASSPGTVTLAVVVDTDGHALSRARFALRELSLIPGVFKLVNGAAPGMSTNVADGSLGQYDFSFPGCAPACEALELFRVQYLDTVNAFEGGMVLEVTGPGPGGENEPPVIYDCDGVEMAAPMGGPVGAGGYSCDGTPYSKGALLLNIVCVLRDSGPSSLTPYANCDAPVGAGFDSVGMLKGRFR